VISISHVDEYPKFSVRVEILITSGGIVLGGKGIAELLKAIEETGSLRRASERLGMNYKRAWMKLKLAEAKAMTPLVERRRGRSGYRLTGQGKEIVHLYYEAEKKLVSCGF